MTKKTIKETIVVEGKTDVNKLLKLFNVNIITTNGSACDAQTINLIKKTHETNGVILLLDPDYVGEQIRKKITKVIPHVQHAFIKREDVLINKKNKLGIAEANDLAIINALEHVVSFSNASKSLSWKEYNQLDLNSKDKRMYICNHYHISYCNNKQLYKRLNLMGLTFQDINSWWEHENTRK